MVVSGLPVGGGWGTNVEKIEARRLKVRYDPLGVDAVPAWEAALVVGEGGDAGPRGLVRAAE